MASDDETIDRLTDEELDELTSPDDNVHIVGDRVHRVAHFGVVHQTLRVGLLGDVLDVALELLDLARERALIVLVAQVAIQPDAGADEQDASRDAADDRGDVHIVLGILHVGLVRIVVRARQFVELLVGAPVPYCGVLYVWPYGCALGWPYCGSA